MRKVMGLLALATMVVLSLALQGCTMARTVRGGGPVEIETRNVSGATGVAVSTPGELTVVLGQDFTLTIETERNLLPYYETEVVGGVLNIRTRPAVRLVSVRAPRFVLTVPALDTVVVSGSARVVAPALTSDRFAIRISGSGNVAVAGLETQALTVSISGSGEAKLGQLTASRVDTALSGSGRIEIAAGEAAEQTVEISGSGAHLAQGLASQVVTVRASGSGKAEVNAAEQLTVYLSGSGTVRYLGNPTVNTRISGSGKVLHIEQ